MLNKTWTRCSKNVYIYYESRHHIFTTSAPHIIVTVDTAVKKCNSQTNVADKFSVPSDNYVFKLLNGTNCTCRSHNKTQQFHLNKRDHVNGENTCENGSISYLRAICYSSEY